MAFRIDQVGLATGVAGRSRTDGLLNGALVTLTNTSGGTTTFRLLWVPYGDTTAVSSLAPTGPGSNVWTFSPTPNCPGTYRIELVRNLGLPNEEREIRQLRVRTASKKLIIPALNEVADHTASLLNNGPAVVEASEDNATDYAVSALNTHDYAGWHRAYHELAVATETAGSQGVTPLENTIYVDSTTTATTRNGSISNPFNSLAEAHAKILTGANASRWVVMLQPNQEFILGVGNPVPVGTPGNSRIITYATFGAPNGNVESARILSPVVNGTNYNVTFVGVVVNELLSQSGTGRIRFFNCWATIAGRYGPTGGCTLEFYNSTLNVNWAIPHTPSEWPIVKAFNCKINRVFAYQVYMVGCEFLDASRLEFSADLPLDAAIVLNTVAVGVSVTWYGPGNNQRVLVDSATRAQLDIASADLTSLVGWLTGLKDFGVLGVSRHVFGPKTVELTSGTDWAVNGAAALNPVAGLAGDCIEFTDSTRTGVGFDAIVPGGARFATFEIMYAQHAGSGLGTYFVLSLALRQVTPYPTRTFSAWSAITTLAVLPGQAAGHWFRTRIRVPLSTLGISHNAFVQFQLIRDTDHASDTAAVDLYVRSIVVEFT